MLGAHHFVPVRLQCGDQLLEAVTDVFSHIEVADGRDPQRRKGHSEIQGSVANVSDADIRQMHSNVRFARSVLGSPRLLLVL
jgi:hypothetical protein